jgi:phosphatidate cytidylyltransferase
VGTKLTNLILRIISSFLLLLFFYSLISEEKFLFPMAIHFLISMSLWETLRLSNFRKLNNISSDNNGFFLTRQKITFFDYLLIFILNLLCFFLIYNSYLLFYIFIAFLLLFLFIQKVSFEKFFGTIYISFPIFFLILLSDDQDFKTYIFFIIFYTIATDVSSFFVGKLIGGPKLAPKISPGKTISGSMGGFFIPALLCTVFFFNYEISSFLIFFTSIFFSLIVQIGDLVESYYKRCCFVKESSNLIPGHGGVLDRFDGFLLLIFFVYILKIFNFNFYFII